MSPIKFLLGRALCVAVTIAVVIASTSGLAHAQDAKKESDWGFQITPYLWLAGMSGDITTQSGLSGSFSKSVGDVLSHLDGGLMLLGEVRYKRWHLLADFDYAKLTIDTNRTGPILGQGSLETREYLGTLEGGYRFVDSDAFKLDGMIGVRVMSIDNTLSFSGGKIPVPSASSSATWADPLVAVRAILPIGSGFFANAYGDVGGGPNGDLTWQVYGGLGYNFNDTITALVGYRYLALNHEVDNLSLNIDQNGPLIGLGFRF